MTEITQVRRRPLSQGRAPGRDWKPCVPTGRIDRKIEFPLPDEKTKKRIFQIHTSRMTLADDVTLDDLIMAKDDLSGADIKVRSWAGFYLFHPMFPDAEGAGRGRRDWAQPAPRTGTDTGPAACAGLCLIGICGARLVSPGEEGKII